MMSLSKLIFFLIENAMRLFILAASKKNRINKNMK